MPTNSANALAQIYNFRAFGPKLATAGQPTEEQFESIQAAGFRAVINLALPTSDNAISHEGSVVTRLGMAYVHIPVDFRAPTSKDFQTFSLLMEAFADRPVFVHCAANMRVSAFVFLYRVLHLGVAAEEAQLDLKAIWQPDDIWGQFIRDELKGAETAR